MRRAIGNVLVKRNRLHKRGAVYDHYGLYHIGVFQGDACGKISSARMTYYVSAVNLQGPSSGTPIDRSAAVPVVTHSWHVLSRAERAARQVHIALSFHRHPRIIAGEPHIRGHQPTKHADTAVRGRGPEGRNEGQEGAGSSSSGG